MKIQSEHYFNVYVTVFSIIMTKYYKWYFLHVSFVKKKCIYFIAFMSIITVETFHFHLLLWFQKQVYEDILNDSIISIHFLNKYIYKSNHSHLMVLKTFGTLSNSQNTCYDCKIFIMVYTILIFLLL